MLNFLKRRRRDKLRARPFPAAWLAHLADNVPFYARLAAEAQAELRGLIQVFLAEKNFEGCGGLEMTDEVRVTIAAQACLLLLHRETDVFPARHHPSWSTRQLRSSRRTAAERRRRGRGGRRRSCVGEAWQHGRGDPGLGRRAAGAARDIRDGYNVVLHEFAHQLDQEDGDADGTPALGAGRATRDVGPCPGREYDAPLRDDVDARPPTLLDAYGADDPAEFFAVATESFFGKAAAMKKRHGALFGLLQGYYRQDPEGFAV